MELRAYAKVNLCLNVLCKRKDGLHEVDHLMQSIDLYDTLLIEPAEGLSLKIEGGLPLCGDNLVLRAARLMMEQADRKMGAAFSLIKRIPVEAGLGGGSADAAAALIGLNRLWGLGLRADGLMALGAALGADVPFFIEGGLARAKGTGTELSFLKRGLALFLVVVKPCEGILAKEAYALWDGRKDTLHPDVSAAAAALEKGDFGAYCAQAANALQAGCERIRPQIGKAIAQLLKTGASGAFMSGSGSAVLGVFKEEKSARTAFLALQKAYPESYFTRAIDEAIQISKNF